ncbi:MAG: hypothetical protein ACE5I1_32100 [bacterium]
MTVLAKQKTISTGITIFLVILLHTFLWFTSIPSKDFSKIYEKLDDKVWTQFLPRKITVERSDPEKPKAEKVEQPKETVENVVEVPPAPVKREKFDPAKFADRLELGLVRKPLQKQDDEMTTDAASSPFIQASQSQFNRTKFRLIEGGAGTIPTLPQKRGTPANTKIQAGQGQAVSDQNSQFKGNGKTPNIPQNLSPNPSTPGLQANDFDRNKIEVSEIFKALIEWVKRHPVALSPQLQQFLGYQDGGLTSKVQFKMNHRKFKMFLLCFEGNYEVRIALVEKSNVTYLVDQGFTKESQKLRAGTVTRILGSGSIATLETQPLPIGHVKNKQFYDIFLYWWEKVKHEVQK